MRMHSMTVVQAVGVFPTLFDVVTSVSGFRVMVCLLDYAM